MRSLKSGVLSVTFASILGLAAVVGCSASGSTDDSSTDPTDPQGSSGGAVLPPATNSSGGSTATDSGKPDSSKVDSGVDAGPPPPVAGDPCTTANQIVKKSCGICGQTSTVCIDDGTNKTWSPYGDCEGELAGGCTPGVTQACGNCGTQTCNQYCGFNSCSGQPANSCSPGNIALVAAGCAANTYRQQVCSATCTLGNISATCEAPPTFVAIPTAVGGIATAIINFVSTQTIASLEADDTCPLSDPIDGDVTPYNYFEVRNTTAQTATVSVFHTATSTGTGADTIMAAYAGATAPTTAAQRKACVQGVADQSDGTDTGDMDFAELTADQAVTIAPGASVMIYSAMYDTMQTLGLYNLNVRTESLK